MNETIFQFSAVVVHRVVGSGQNNPVDAAASAKPAREKATG
jgi:hypothetical protein